MPFWKIAWRNMEQRGLASALTALSMALLVEEPHAAVRPHAGVPDHTRIGRDRLELPGAELEAQQLVTSLDEVPEQQRGAVRPPVLRPHLTGELEL